MNTVLGGSSVRPLSTGLAIVPVVDIHPCPLQPRVSVSVDLVQKLAESMRAGRHDPVLEVEPSPDRPGNYQIVCGEQRWRAAKEAGLEQVLVRVHERLTYLERLQKQSEENRLRADLTPIEEAELVVMTKTLMDIGAAERLLGDAGVAFTPLESKRPSAREQVIQHLDSLKELLLESRINVVSTAAGPAVGPLSPWRQTEATLAISESTRKAKLALLRLEPEELDRIGGLPSNHVSLIARVDDDQRRSELADQAALLSNRQLHGVVNRLRQDPTLTVADALAGTAARTRPNPLTFEIQLEHLCDLCRQITRLLNNFAPRLLAAEKDQLVVVLNQLRGSLDAFEEAA